MVFYVVAIILLLYSLIINGKKGFFLFLGFSLFLNTNIALVSIPGIPILSLGDFLIVCYYLFWRLKDKRCRSRITNPWFTPYLLISFVVILSSFFAVAGFESEITAAIKNIIENALIVNLCWEYIDSEDDFSYIYKVITVVFLLSCIYGFFEYSIQMNPLSIYERTLNHDASKAIDNSYAIDSIRGYRINSIFDHAIGAGCNWAMYIILTLSLFVQQKKHYINVVSLITAGLCLVCIILCKQRSSLLFLAIGLLSCVNFKKKRMIWVVLFAFVSLFLILPFIIENASFLSRMFDVNASLGGSSLNLRIRQFNAGFQLFKLSPILGLGSKFKQIISNQYTDAVLGLESIWLKDGILYGLLGIASDIILLYYEIIMLPKFFKKKYVLFIALSYWITASATTIPGFSVALYYSIFTIMYKSSKKYLKFDPKIRMIEWRIKGGRILRKRIYK